MLFGIWFICLFFFFKQKTAYEMRISDWSSDVCSSDLTGDGNQRECTDACAAGVVLAIPANRKGERVGDGETDDMGGYLPPRALKHAGLPVLRDCSRSEVKG